MRGYVDEMRDFMESIYYNREPKSDYWVAHETLRVIYAAYKSAESRYVSKIIRYILAILEIF